MLSEKARQRRKAKQARLFRMVYLSEREDAETNPKIQQELEKLRNERWNKKPGRNGLTVQVIKDGKAIFEGNKNEVIEFCGVTKYEASKRIKTRTPDNQGRYYIKLKKNSEE